MPEPTTLAVFVAACLALYLSPGPDMLYIASRSISGGVRIGICSALGVAAGLLVHMVAAAFGLGAVLVMWPAAFLVVKWIGAAYLLYLGVKILLAPDGPVRVDSTSRSPGWVAFRQGVLVNVLNPKIAIFFLAFLPQFVDPGTGDATTQLLILGALFNAGGLVWVLVQALVFGRIGNWLTRRPGVLKWQRRFTGTVLIGLAANLATQQR